MSRLHLLELILKSDKLTGLRLLLGHKRLPCLLLELTDLVLEVLVVLLQSQLSNCLQIVLSLLLERQLAFKRMQFLIVEVFQVVVPGIKLVRIVVHYILELLFDGVYDVFLMVP